MARGSFGQKPIVIAAIVVCFMFAGCGRGDKYPREPFSGTVTLDGQPLNRGYVVLEPKDGQPTQSGGMIQDGKFVVSRESGAMPGKYAVAVFSGAEEPVTKADPGTPEAEAAAMKMKNTGERVPRKYNIDTTLTAEVKAGEENVFKYDLSTKK